MKYKRSMENRTEPRTAGQWIRYIVVAVIAIHFCPKQDRVVMSALESEGFGS
jgi:hypothetical protein